jgi:2-(1,2-epoxy-1,2-dihydrophenyl)acetyl-CoA isomerase
VSEFETIRYEVSDGIGRLTLDRPEQRNAITNRMVRELYEATSLAAADPSLKVLVLTGSGSAFCPGADLSHFTSGGTDERLHPRHFRATTLLHEMPAVTVALVNGACAGAALGWALACDLRIATASARFNIAFLDVGVAGDMGGTWLLTQLLGGAKARELCLLPGKFDAAEAQRLGLVSRVVDDESFAEEGEALVSRLASYSPTALWGLKSNLLAAERTTFADYVDLESERHIRITASEDTAEGFRAFMEKRPPRFTGR